MLHSNSVTEAPFSIELVNFNKTLNNIDLKKPFKNEIFSSRCYAKDDFIDFLLLNVKFSLANIELLFNRWSIKS